MASGDARPVPIKNVAFRVTFPIFDADGDLVSAASGLDSEISKDGGTFTDCTNEATEIATNSGIYYLDLTNTEMNADTVAIIVKTVSVDAKTTPIILYPEETGDINVDVTQMATDVITSGALSAGAVAEIVAAILDTTIAEPTAAFDWSSATLKKILQAEGAFTNNKITATSGVITLRNAADDANIATGSHSDDGTTYTRNKFG
jgi:hypothetical protein